jgi:hypothetical protein
MIDRAIAQPSTAAEKLWLERITGRDPFDALMGTRVPSFVRGSATLRQAGIQAGKRFPLDLGPLLGVQPFAMAKTAGAYMSAVARERESPGQLEDLGALAAVADSCMGCLGDGMWGYEFDVQTRWAYYPAGSPNLIATVFVARGFGEASAACGHPDWMEQLHQSAKYLAASLYERDAGSPSFRYVPTSTTLVHNANLLGAGLVAASAALRDDGVLLGAALAAALTSVEAQERDGSWPYGVGAKLAWQDNFHTAYDLDGLLLVWLATGDPRVEASLRLGASYWTERFFGRAGEPWYGPDSPYPLDIHSAGTAIDVAARLSTWGVLDDVLAAQVSEWTESHLVDSVAHATWYRVNRSYTDRRHFPRWGDAHLALGRSSLSMARAGRLSPLELAVHDANVRRSAGRGRT